MKIFLAAGLALAATTGLATAAQAADIESVYDWSGFNAGVNAGVGLNNSDAKTDIDIAGRPAWLNSGSKSSDNDSTTFTGGASLGYDWQVDKIVFGLETDLNYGGFSGDSTTRYENSFGVTGQNATNKFSYNSDWYGTMRGRLGYAADNILFYGTAGLAYAGLDTENTIDLGTKNGFKDTNKYLSIGWTAGAGVEYGFGNWSLGAEYLYVDLGSPNSDDDFLNATAKGEVDYHFSVMRATAKLRF